MFELSRLIARNCEFRPSPDKSEARKGFFSQPYREKNAEPGSPSFGYFSWRSKKSDSPLGEIWWRFKICLISNEFNGNVARELLNLKHNCRDRHSSIENKIFLGETK
jgi:hypothetical protein